MSLLVSELMTNDVLTISAEAPVTQAVAEMRLGHVRHLPVVDGAGLLTGMLSRDELLRAKDLRGQVQDIMASRVLSVREDDLAADAARLMRSKKVTSLPVLDAEGHVVGLITESDFLEVAERALRGKPLGRRG